MPFKLSELTVPEESRIVADTPHYPAHSRLEQSVIVMSLLRFASSPHHRSWNPYTIKMTVQLRWRSTGRCASRCPLGVRRKRLVRNI